MPLTFYGQFANNDEEDKKKPSQVAGEQVKIDQSNKSGLNFYGTFADTGAEVKARAARFQAQEAAPKPAPPPEPAKPNFWDQVKNTVSEAIQGLIRKNEPVVSPLPSQQVSTGVQQPATTTATPTPKTLNVTPTTGTGSKGLSLDLGGAPVSGQSATLTAGPQAKADSIYNQYLRPFQENVLTPIVTKGPLEIGIEHGQEFLSNPNNFYITKPLSVIQETTDNIFKSVPLLSGFQKGASSMYMNNAKSFEEYANTKLKAPEDFFGKTQYTVGEIVGGLVGFMAGGEVVQGVKAIKGAKAAKAALPLLYAALGQTSASSKTTILQRLEKMPLNLVEGFLFGMLPASNKLLSKETAKGAGLILGATAPIAFINNLIEGMKPKEAAEVAAKAAVIQSLFHIASVGINESISLKERQFNGVVTTPEQARVQVESTNMPENLRSDLKTAIVNAEIQGKDIKVSAVEVKPAPVSKVIGGEATQAITGQKQVNSFSFKVELVDKKTINLISEQGATPEPQQSALSLSQPQTGITAQSPSVNPPTSVLSPTQSVTSPPASITGEKGTAPSGGGEPIIKNVPIEDIGNGLTFVKPEQLNTNTPKIKALEVAIKNGESIPPIPVYEEANGKYVINKDGYHRLQAYKNLDYKDVPVVIQEKTQLSGSAKQRVENATNKVEPQKPEPTTLYHGSNASFSQFDMKKLGTGEGSDKFGKGAYLTDNKDIAQFYAEKVAKKQFIEKTTPTGIFGSDVPVYKANADQLAKQSAKVNEFIADKLNILDASTYQIDKDVLGAFIDIVKDRGLSEAQAKFLVNKTLNFAKTRSKEIVNYIGELPYMIDQLAIGDNAGKEKIANILKSKGYDGIKYQSDRQFEGKGAYNYVIYNPEKLTSNQGEVAKSDIIKTNGESNTTNKSSAVSNADEVRLKNNRISSTEANVGKTNEPTTSPSELGARPQRARVGKVGRTEANNEAVSILENKNYSTNPSEYTSEELSKLGQYSGAGGKESAGATGKGLLSEYYTPPEVTSKVWEIINRIAPDAKTALEPSIGTGSLLYGRNTNIKFDAYEYQRVSGTIAKILNPDININIGNGKEFGNKGTFENNNHKPKYDLVVGNPPFGERSSFLKGKGEEPKINRWEEYFIKSGLDVLNNNGVLVYVVNSSFLNKTDNNYAKVEIAKLGKLIQAYRLPEGTFADTSTGTDIVVFQKDPTTNIETINSRIKDITNGSYFVNNPQNIAGTVETRKNRFGQLETYVKGTVDDIKNLEVSGELIKSNKTEEQIAEVKNESKEYAVNTIKRVNTEANQETLPAIITPDKKKVEVIATQTIGKSNSSDPIEKNILRETKVDGSVDYKPEYKKYLNYYDGKYYHDLNYFSGDIYQKIDTLKADKNKIINELGQEQYEKQLKGLDAIKPKRVTIDEVTFDPLDRFVSKIEAVPADGTRKSVSVAEQFISFLNTTDSSLSYGVDRYDIRNYVLGSRAAKGKKNVMGAIKSDANRLFNYFIRNVLDESLQKEIIDKFNKEKNSYVNPDYSKLPTEISGMAKYFRGNEFKLSGTQESGISFLTNKGVGLIAYGVGVGKTHTLLVATMVAHQKGWNKRPAFIVPKSTITKTWIGTIKSMFPNQTIVNLGGLNKPDIDRLEKSRGKDKTKWIKDGEISVLTHEGLLRLGLDPSEMEAAIGDLQDALQSETNTERSRQAQASKMTEILGRAQYKAGDVMLKDLGIDHISVDEVHNFRKIFQGAKPEVLNKDGTVDKTVTKRFANVIGGTPSKQAQQLFLISQYILKKNGNRGVYLASATPFENHATEVYNILSLVARDRLKSMGIFNINDFFALFSNFETELEKNVQGEWVNKEKMKSFKNLPQLQKLLREFVDYQTDPTLVRPERRVITPHLQMSAPQEENLIRIQEMLKPAEGKAPEEGAVLKATTYSVANSISPYFIKEWHPEIVSPTKLIEDSPKLKYSMELIKELKADTKVNKHGTFLYIGANGVEYHGHIADYAIKNLGFKPSEVAIINGSTPNDEREAIKDEFQSGKVKLLIGGDPTKEGIDLQKNGYTTINVALGWNPTEVAQVEGRVWRQGNKRSIAPLVYPLVENSGDITVYNKFEEKGSRINDLFSYKGQVFDVGELDPKEKKLALMTKPEDKANLEIEIDKVEAQNKLSLYSTDISNLNRIQTRINQLSSSIPYYEKFISTGKDRWGYDLKDEEIANYKKELDKEKRELKSIEAYLDKKQIKDIPEKIKEIEALKSKTESDIKKISDTYQERLQKFQREYADMIANRKSIADNIKDFKESTKDLVELTDEQIKEKVAKLRQELGLDEKPSARAPSGQATTTTKTVDEFETREAPEVRSDHYMKLYEKVQGLIRKYARTIGQGYKPSGSLGVYYPQTTNIRVNGMNDLSVATHEIAHFLDDAYKISNVLMGITGETSNGRPIYDKSTREFRREITDIYEKYYPTGKRTHNLKKRVTEGFATLLQKYSEMPKQISKEFPDLVNSFLKEGGEYYKPVIGEILKDLDAIINEYQGLSDLDKIGARRSSGKISTGKKEFLNIKDKIRTFIEDELYPAEKIAKETDTWMTKADPSLWMRSLKNAAGVYANNILNEKHGYFSFNENGDWVKKHTFNWATLTTHLNNEKTWDSFNNYLIARDQHYNWIELDNLEKAYKDIQLEASKMTPDERAMLVDDDGLTIIDRLKVAKEAYEQQKGYLSRNGMDRKTVDGAFFSNEERFRKETEMFDALTKEDWDLLYHKDVQLINQEQHDNGKIGYASMRRVMYDDILGDAQAQFVGSSGKVSSTIGRTGGQQAIIDPVHSGMMNHIEAVKKSMKQVVVNKFGEIAQKSMLPTMMQPVPLTKYPDEKGRIVYPQDKDPKILMARKDYKRYPILVDPVIRKVIDTALTYQSMNIFEKLLVSAGRIFTAGTTGLYAPFALVNFPIDQWTAVMNTRNKYTPVVDQLKILGKRVIDKGGDVSRYYEEWQVLGGDRMTLMQAQMQTSEDAIKYITKEAKGLEKAINLIDKGVDILSIPSNTSETASRFVEYYKARASGKSQVVALEEAGRVTAPFHHIGSWKIGDAPSAKYVFRSIPFGNASLQVLAQMGRTAETAQGRKRIALLMLAMTALYLASMYAVAMAGSDDQKEQFKDLRPSDLGQYLHFPAWGGKGLYRVKVSPELSIIGTVIQMIISDNMLKAKYSAEDYKNALTGWVPKQFNVLQPVEMFFSWFNPAIKIPIELMANFKDYPTIKPIESMGMLNKEPRYRYNESTSMLAKYLGDKFNLSPVKIDFLINGFFGRVSGYVTGKPNAYSMTNQVYRDYFFTMGRRVENFYDDSQKVDQHYKALKDKYEKTGVPKELEQDLKDTKRKRAIYTQVDKLLTEYRKINLEKENEKALKYRKEIVRLLDLIDKEDK